MDNTARGSLKTSNLKLNYKRTFIIGFAFFGILLLWQVYDSWCPTFLTELFMEALNASEEEDVQYLVGVMMAFDNLAALVLLPLFGHLSDKTHTKIGKRMPYILVGTFLCAVAFPFIPVLFHMHNIIGTIAVMGVVVFFAMMYRNPAVALMPDITPKPLRSKANGIINIMGYLGGACATFVGIAFSLSSYLGENSSLWRNKEGNIWTIEIPFLIASFLMLVSALVLFFRVNENKITKEVEKDMEIGEKEAEVEVKEEENGKMSKSNKRMLMLILVAEFFWFMADNGISTFMANYTIYHIGAEFGNNMINVIVGGVGSVIGFALGGIISGRIGRKKTISIGLILTVLSLLCWVVLSYTIPYQQLESGYNAFPIYLYVVWFVKGLGMSFVHVNSYPMVVELCTGTKVGRFTGYYYASSMASQTVTPCLLGLLLLIPGLDFSFLPIYALLCAVLSISIFFFVKNTRNRKAILVRGLV